MVALPVSAITGLLAFGLDIPGASLNAWALNGREPDQLHVMELKRWLSAEVLQQLERSRTL